MPNWALYDAMADSRFIIYGTFKNLPASKDTTGKSVSQSIITIEGCIKNHPVLKDVKTVHLNRQMPDDQLGKKIILFGDVTEGKTDYYQWLRHSPELVDYMKSLDQIAPKDVAK